MNINTSYHVIKTYIWSLIDTLFPLFCCEGSVLNKHLAFRKKVQIKSGLADTKFILI